MKKLLFGALFFLLNSQFSSAQLIDLDPNAINQQSKSEVAQNKVKKHVVLKFLGKTAKHVSKIFLLPPGTIAHAQKLNPVEEAQVRLLSCVEDIITENKGGSQAFSIAQKILLSAMNNNALSTDTGDNGILDKAYVDCHKLYDSLDGYSDHEIGRKKKQRAFDALSETTMAEQKINKLLYGISYPKILHCDLGELSIEAAWVVGPSVGLNKLKCLYSNGKVKNGFGFSLRGTYGLGAAIQIRSYQSKAAAFVGPLVLQSDDESLGDLQSIPVIGILDDQGKSVNGLGVGAGAFAGSVEMGAGIRFFNGKRRWNVLLDLLK